ncbi:uncharacterized protein LOC105663393 isoform X2 [Megachile rotundata]|uniref:uncharacterized protein LOC105663393 isoform X2 n=1 Tax=Megachile rotundata TaxID=143995 RepID=UPI000614F0D4|nr:PREDICTED: uncharacterized protein LOC105663393 [Megachile rotundata]
MSTKNNKGGSITSGATARMMQEARKKIKKREQKKKEEEERSREETADRKNRTRKASGEIGALKAPKRARQKEPVERSTNSNRRNWAPENEREEGLLLMEVAENVEKMERNKNECRKQKKGGKEGIREEALVKYPKGEFTYEQALIWIKNKVAKLTALINEVRETKAKDIYFVFGNERGGLRIEEFAEIINREGNGKWEVHIHTNRKLVYIKLWDPNVNEEEILEALSSSDIGTFVEQGEIRIREIQGERNSAMRTAILKCTRRAAKLLLQQNIRVKSQELKPFIPRVRGKKIKKARRH